MGQYHLPVNLTKREFFSPHDFGDGLKLLEQNGGGYGSTTSALHALLACSDNRGGGDLRMEICGRWAGDRVAMIGDYTEPDDLGEEIDASLIYHLCASDSDARGAVAYWRKYAVESGRQDYDGRAARLEAELDAKGPYTDVSLLVRAEFEARGITYTGDGWVTREGYL